MDHGYLPRHSVPLQTVAMRPPQSINQLFSSRLFFPTFTITLFVALLFLSGQASAQQLTCTPSILEFGLVNLGQNLTQPVILTNNGATSVTISAMNLRTTEFSVTQLSLPLTLSAGESVAFSVTFTPTLTTWIPDRVILTSNASNPSLQLLLRGVGVTRDPITVSPASLSFGSVPVGTSVTKSVVISDVRSWGRTISSVQTMGNEISVTGPGLPVALTGGQSITLNVTFTPTAAGVSGGYLYLTGPGVAQSVPFSGTGTTAVTPPPPPPPPPSGQLTITPASLNFGSVPDGTTQTQSISLSAIGASVTISSSASSSSQFALNGASFPLTIAAGQSVSFNVAFTPQSSGSVSGSLSFASNASTSGTLASLTGVGTATQYNVNLSWNPSSDVTGYNVYRSTAANGKYSKINPSVNPNTAYVDSTVVSGQTYYYAATSVSSSGQESALSTPPVAASVP